jgi:galactitol-specific phosphotransferase system IIB component
MDFKVCFKGIGSTLFLKNGLKKICRKNYKNHLRRNNCEVCTAVARCFPNILDVIILENIN